MAMTCERVRELAPGFVLGALEADEMIAVQDHLDQCDAGHPEIDEFGGVVPYIGQSLEPVEPPAWLRESVIAAAKADSRARRRVGKGTEHRMAEHAPAPVEPISHEEPADAAAEALPANVIPLRSRVWARRGRIATWTTRVAAALLVVSLGGYAFVVQNQRQAEPPISYYITANTQQAGLAPTDAKSSTGGLAVLQRTGHLYVEVHDLAPTSGDQVYMVWVSGANGDISKIGSFKIDPTGSARLEYENVPTSPSLWLFICKEPNAGVNKPTGPIILSGTLST